MTENTEELHIRKAVRERYAKLASANSSSCCGGSSSSSLISITKEIPTEASSVSAGCGSPLEIVSLREGDSVLDLGSGGGIDVFGASLLVGKTGRAIGVDSTPEMISRARQTKEKYRDKYSNVEFRLGEIEHSPVESESVDYVISNCVINLSPDKRAVFKESFRVLKEGGTFAVADITLPKEIPVSARKDMDSWSACMAGALTDSDYEQMLAEAGFQNIRIEHVSSSSIGECPFPYHSSHITATKAEK